MNIPLKQYWHLLVTYLRSQWLRIGILAVLLLTSIGLQLLNPQILRYFIDTARGSAAINAVLIAGLLFLGLSVLQQILAIVATYLTENVGWIATNALRTDLTRHCLRLDMSFHNRHAPGELIERIDGDVTVLANFFAQLIVQVIGNGVLLVGVLTILFWEDWRVGLALLLCTLLALVALSRIRNIVAPYWAAGRQASAGFAGFLEERLIATEDIRSSGAISYKLRLIHEHMRELMQRYRKARFIGELAPMTARLSFALGNIIGLALGAYLYLQGSVTLGTVYLISYYTGLIAQPLERLTGQVQELQQASASIGRVEELFLQQSAIEERPAETVADISTKGGVAVAFEHVWFGYNKDNPVLRNVSFALEPGRILGLLGRTGSGKTTLARLICRLYDPDQGAICFNGVDIRDLRLSALRRRIGIVTQDVQLLHATIRDNLTFFDRSISDEQLLRALAQLGLLSWLDTLPAGLDTELAANSGLSAGEAQLLAFTRVLLKDPGLVILDEASSRLDPATERLIERAVAGLLHNRTGIIIAHRLQTVQRVDDIMILDSGEICEYGSRTELTADPSSRFAQLLRTGLEEVMA